MQKSLVLLLALYASSAPAQVVYKCVAKGKPTSFQSEPCPGGSRTVKAVAATADVYQPAPTYRPPVTQQQVTVSNVAYNNVETRYDERTQRRANCQAQKNYRQNTLDRVGLARTYNLLQQLDADVYNACKGL